MKANDYIELANISKDLLIERRRNEWKITFGFLAAIGIITYSLLEFYKDSHLGDSNYLILSIGFIIITIMYAMWHLPSVAGSNRKDLDLIIYFREKAQAELGDTLKANNDFKLEELKVNAWCYAIKKPIYWHCFIPQVIISFIVLIISLKLLCTIR
jgi:hypothetical protein